MAAETRPLNDEESMAVLCGPCAVFLAIAAADGKVDKKEIDTYVGITVGIAAGVGKAQELDPFLREIFQKSANDIQNVLVECLKRGAGIQHFIQTARRAGELVDAAHGTDAGLKFRQAMVGLGYAIAQSSGGFLGIFGSKVSKEEKQVLGMIAQALGLA